MGQKDHLYMNFEISNEKMKNVSKVVRIYEELFLKNTYRTSPKVIIKISVP